MFTMQIDTKFSKMHSHFLGLHKHHLDNIDISLVMKCTRLANPRI